MYRAKRVYTSNKGKNWPVCSMHFNIASIIKLVQNSQYIIFLIFLPIHQRLYYKWNWCWCQLQHDMQMHGNCNTDYQHWYTCLPHFYKELIMIFECVNCFSNSITFVYSTVIDYKGIFITLQPQKNHSFIVFKYIYRIHWALENIFWRNCMSS